MMNLLHHRPGAHRFAARRMIDVYHRVVCRHQVEIEVWPPRAEVHFADDWTANPAGTQTRFEAIVTNSDQGYLFEVRAPDGSLGQGTIDVSGLYRAPPKGALPSGSTEIIVATAREDRLRKAFAWVTLVGLGPEPVTAPTIDILPKRLNLYYQHGFNNDFMDDSNKRRRFSATLHDGTGVIEWIVNNNGIVVGSGSSFLYQTPNAGVTSTVTIRARLQAQHAIFDEAQVEQLNYDWPTV